MPRATTGPKVKERTLQVLASLLSYANHELELASDIPGLHCRWQDSPPPTLIVQTTLRSLLELNQRTFPDKPLKKPQVREALNRLEDFLAVLEDYRVHQRGSEEWHFALHLASQETDRAIATAATQWESLKTPQATTPTSNSAAAESPPLPGLRRGAPFQVPPLPHYFVDRPEPLNAVKTYLLENAPHRPGTLVVSAIQGLGGIGKSVLASAIAYDPTVQSRFADGVLWSTLGQQPDILACLSGWIQELGDHSYKPTTPSSASAHLRTLLHDRRMLLVVDDVWDPGHAEPFRVGGSDCCILVTTREARIPGALRYDLDVMTPEQSLALLKQSIQEELSDAAIQEALALAKAVAYLPLALELAAAQIEDGATWAELLDALAQEIADLDVLDIQGYGFQSQTSKQRNLSLLASFNLSLKRLPPEQLNQFAWLGVLPEDVTIPETMAATLWDMQPAQARTLLRFLKGRALLLSSGRQADQRVGYRLHDLMHDVARHLLTGNPQPDQPGMLPGLGMTLQEAHQQLMNRYRSKLQEGQWHTAPNDGYIHTHLTWHLEQAGLIEEIHQLLKEENADGKNAWYVACRTLDQVAGFANDVARAWRLAETQFKNHPSKSLGLQCRYALIKGSLNTLAGNFPSELIAALVAEGVWQPAQGLAHLQQAPAPRRQLRSFQALLPHLPDTLLNEAREVARWIPDRVCRSIALIELSTRLPELRSDALELAEAIGEDYQRVLALGTIAQYRPHLWPSVLATIQIAKLEKDKGPLLREVSSFLPDNLLSQAFEMASQVQDPYSRAIGMAALSQRMPQTAAATVGSNLDQVRKIPETYGRAWALAALAALDPSLWAETITQVQSIEHEHAKARLIANLAPYIPTSLLLDVINIGYAIQHESRRCIALGALTIRHSALWSDVLADTQIIRDAEMAIKGLCALSDLVESLRPLAVEMAQEIEHIYERAIALCSIAVSNPDYWPKAYTTTLKIDDVADRATALEGIATKMPELWPYAQRTVQAIQHAHHTVQHLQRLVLKMPELWPDTVQATRELWYETQQALTIYRLSLSIPSEFVADFVNIAEAIRDDYDRLLAFSALSSHQPELLEPTWHLLKSLNFSGEQEDYRARALAAFAVAQPDIWTDAIRTLAEIQDERRRSIAIYEIAPLVPQELLAPILDISFTISIEFYRAEAFLELLPRLDLSVLGPSVTCSILQTLSYLTRDKILELMPSLSDAIFALGGEEAIMETTYALRDVGRQW
ncbi:NB-ARC domain-containing protein [Halomicronema sp. CCY15110]|uniref:NB-ARC domain-containing protein n=1 Tax=Halomicronema sp. CCY15110 TaxID=2767773 RepID=UPI0019500005|nr:NB-ARC domain-containing protein [Halomicronema sp. CCY15110]